MYMLTLDLHRSGGKRIMTLVSDLILIVLTCMKLLLYWKSSVFQVKEDGKVQYKDQQEELSSRSLEQRIKCLCGELSIHFCQDT